MRAVTRSDDLAIKRERMKDFLNLHDLGGMLITQQKSFSWYTSGGQSHVALASEGGVAQVLVTPAQDYLIANNIEIDRLMDEEGLGELGFQPLTYRWDGGPDDVARLVAGALDGKTHETDTGALAGELNHLRYQLTPLEVERYRALGRDSGTAISDVARAIEPGMSEWQIAGMLSGALADRQIAPAVVLVAVDERISLYRHPIPTDKRLVSRAMLVICGRRHGLIVSATRLVNFGALSDDLRRRHDACMDIDATFITGTTIGADVDELFQQAVDAYDAHGFGEEWMLHHQGGGTGYETRDFKGTLQCREAVQPWQAFAWNPSITGTKSEDTIIATPDGPEIISMTPDWPTVEFNAPGGAPSILRGDILVR